MWVSMKFPRSMGASDLLMSFLFREAQTPPRGKVQCGIFGFSLDNKTLPIFRKKTLSNTLDARAGGRLSLYLGQ